MSKYTHNMIGKLVILGFTGQSVTSELRSIGKTFDLGGVILFNRNVESPFQIANLAHEVISLSTEWPPWVSIDQEGGRVARLAAPFTRWPPMSALGHSQDIDLAKRFSKALSQELSAVGITLNYAPVLDVNTNPDNPVIGDRAFSDEVERVSKFGIAVIEGLQAGGVAACGKHFPGHGDTVSDSHFDLPVVDRPADDLVQIEMHPFRAASSCGVATMMTAHVIYREIDEMIPATLSKKILTDVLREDLGFKGLLISDDMEMKAITRIRSIEDAAVEAIAAGCDMVLLCGGDVDLQIAVIEALIDAVEKKVISQSRLEEALSRQESVKSRFLAGVRRQRPISLRALNELIGSEEHQNVATEIERLI